MNSKKKGNRGENVFANWLSLKGIKAWRDSASGGANKEKSDVGNNINHHYEVKTVKSLNLKKAWNQSVTAASKTANTPHVVIHFDGMPETRWLVVMDSEDWIELVLKAQEPKTAQKEMHTKDKWIFQQASKWCKEVIKVIE